MEMRYRKFLRGKTWWVQDSQAQANGKAGKQRSLRTKDEAEAERLLASMNEPYRFAAFHIQMARTHLQLGNYEITQRTWQQVMDAVIQDKQGKTKERYQRAAKEKAFNLIRNIPLVETTSEHLQAVMIKGKVATNGRHDTQQPGERM